MERSRSMATAGSKRRREATKAVTVECPMCGKVVFSSMVEEHVWECLRKSSQGGPGARKRKRALSDGSSSRPKRRAPIHDDECFLISSDEESEDEATGFLITKPTRVHHNKPNPIPPAPVFYPTHAEWENPYEYINKVRSSAEPYGICKIVPPPKTRGCTPESFAAVVDDSEFKFSTKAQYVHLLSRRGPCQCFMMHLKSYLESTGRTLQTELPMVGNRPINLYLLYRAVDDHGGVDLLHSEQLWVEVASEFHLHPITPEIVRDLKQTYVVLLEPFARSGLGRVALEQSRRREGAVTDEGSDDEDREWGFGEGGPHRLCNYREAANRFQRQWYGRDQSDIPVEEIEAGYWDIVDRGEPCVVEYGSDLDVVKHGSGFPVDDSISGWNLTHLPTYSGSLFQHLRQHIMGVTTPMMYVGMMFSCFCWHTEDNHLYSINYVHTGAPKVWYGVPSKSSEMFENVMRVALPTLFKIEPDLLHKLVTMLNPIELRRKRVPLVRTVQQAGEYVITFPRAYHGGINTGFNVAEAVNFATEHWLTFGLHCVIMYKRVKRASVVSFPELVFDGLRSRAYRSQEAERLLLRMFRFLRNEEKENRSRLVSQGLSKCSRWFTSSLPRSLPCSICQMECFFSTVMCECDAAEGKNACLDHAFQKVLRIRLTISQLDALIAEHEGGGAVIAID